MSSVRCSVGVLIVSYDGSVILQHRDDDPGIAFPDKIGLFGGLVKRGESPEFAAKREILEELSISPHKFEFRQKLVLSQGGSDLVRERFFFKANISSSLEHAIHLTEGQARLRFHLHEMPYPALFVPYDLAYILSEFHCCI